MNIMLSDRLLLADELLKDTIRLIFHTSKFRVEILKKSIIIKILAVLNIDVFRNMRVGTQILCYNDSYSFNAIYDEIYKRGIYDIDLKTDTPVIMDAGSNIGMSILNFKRLYPNANIIGFEPIADSYSMIKKNVQLNHLKNVKVHPVGVFSSYKDETIYRGADITSVYASIYHKEVGHPVKIKLVRMSDYIHDRIDMLKLDIEESEYEVISDLIKTDKIKYIRNMAVEFHDIINRNHDFYALMDQLSKLYDTRIVDFNSCGIIVVQFSSKTAA